MDTMTSDPNGPGGSQQPGWQPRIGDAERQAAVEALSEHFVAGRLDSAEFNQRMDAALQARTAAELAPLFADLPRLDMPGPDTYEHQAVAPIMPPYLPAEPPQTAKAPATSGRSRAQTLQLVRTLVWPIAIVLVIFTGADFLPVIGAAILVSIIVGKLLDQEKKAGRDVPPAWREPIDRGDDEPPSIDPSGRPPQR